MMDFINVIWPNLKKHRCNFQCPDFKSYCKEDFEHISSHNFTIETKKTASLLIN